MKTNSLLNNLMARLRLSRDAELAKYLGYTRQTLISWRHDNKTLDARRLTSMIVKARKAGTQSAHSGAVSPIIEFFPINSWRPNARYYLFNYGNKARPYKRAIKKCLDEKHGLYIFYDSRGRALYVGKADKLTLWKEMNNAFNRIRETTQQVYRIRHPERQGQFRTANEKNRQPRLGHVYLYEPAKYFSAYEANTAVVHSLEALLVRGFANDLLNARMETFTKRKRKRRSRKKR